MATDMLRDDKMTTLLLILFPYIRSQNGKNSLIIRENKKKHQLTETVTWISKVNEIISEHSEGNCREKYD